MNVKVPAIIVCSVLCLAIGAGAGVVGMTFFGYAVEAPPAPEPAAAKGGGMDKKGAPPTDKGKDKGKGKGKDKGPTKGKGKEPDGRGQLITLVAKLDLLTGKPLQLDLSAEQKSKLREQLSGLTKLDELPDAEARKRTDALVVMLKEHGEVLEAVGLPISPAAKQEPSTAANPFRQGPPSVHLKAIQERLQ